MNEDQPETTIHHERRATTRSLGWRLTALAEDAEHAKSIITNFIQPGAIVRITRETKRLYLWTCPKHDYEPDVSLTVMRCRICGKKAPRKSAGIIAGPDDAS